MPNKNSEVKICGRCHSTTNSPKHAKCRKKHSVEMNKWYHRLKKDEPAKFVEYRKKLLINANRLRKEKPEEHRLRTLRWKLNNYAKHLYIKTRNRAMHKGIKFSISIKWIEKRLNANKCEVTRLVFQTNGLESSRSHPFQPSIDRKDMTKRYTPKNSRVVCAIYNYAKHTYTHEDVVKLARSLA